MNHVICPRCGTINSTDAMNCQKCRINLKFAFENPDLAKGIILPEQAPQVVQEFSSSKFRASAWIIGGFAFTLLIGLPLNYVSQGFISWGWLGSVFFLAAIVVLKAFFQFPNYQVVILADGLSGPSASGGDRVSFKFEQIDTSKIGSYTFFERIDGSRSVYAINGKRIVLSSWVYNPSQIQAILNKIRSEIK